MTIRKFGRFFAIPIFVALCIVAYTILQYGMNYTLLANIVAFAGILAGSFNLVRDTLETLRRKELALDYIAILAIVVGIATGSYLVALIIVLMLSGGNTLESYAMSRARESLHALAHRIPLEVTLWEKGSAGSIVPIALVNVGTEIIIRKGEVVPLDGKLVSSGAFIDESSLTGEAWSVEKIIGDSVRSGTTNVGEMIVVRVTTHDSESTYRNIVNLVEKARAERAPIVRLANKYSGIFTIITIILATLAYVLSGDSIRILAVLVAATPCPLILATPIALFGGMNKGARQNILVKNPASLESLTRVTDIVFDKTGTITIGKPVLKNLSVISDLYSEADIWKISTALERNSLHPFAKTIVAHSQSINVEKISATDIQESVGKGISGIVLGKKYLIAKALGNEASIVLSEGNTPIANFTFEDKVKDDYKSIISLLKKIGMSLHIFTGDKRENIAEALHMSEGGETRVDITANMSPIDKEGGIRKLKALGRNVAMVGDGINDAPALALADVGMVFSNEEQTAASEAADMVFLGGGLSSVLQSISISKRTVSIAIQSIFIGIGLSVITMIFAAFGFITPIAGALIQEGIDVFVILNALRASY